jgi:hypothetical protein
MNRRQLIAALGAATGASGIVGTGAFTSVRADRSVDVQVAGDDSAYLRLTEASDRRSADPGDNSKAYVDTSGDQVSLDFSGSNDTADLGDGFNVDAVTEIKDLLKMENQGTQSVYLSVDVAALDISDSNGNGAYIGLSVDRGGGFDDILNRNIAFDSQNPGSNVGGAVPDPTDDGPYELNVGQNVNLNLTVDTTPLTGTGVSTGGSITFVADQESSL